MISENVLNKKAYVLSGFLVALFFFYNDSFFMVYIDTVILKKKEVSYWTCGFSNILNNDGLFMVLYEYKK